MEKEEKTSDVKEQKKPIYKKWWLWALIVVIIAAIAGGCYWFYNIKVPYDEAIAAYYKAIEYVEGKNAEADDAISTAQTLLDSDKIPFEESVITDLQLKISSFREAKREIKDMPEKTNDIIAETEKLNEPLDYSQWISEIQAAQQSFEDSVKQLEQITNPTGDFIIERINEIESVGDIQGVTEDNDPNGNLNKQGGYTSTTYFTSPLVDQTDIVGDDVVAKGTDAGGGIEVYKTVEEAEARNTYLASFDGAGIFNSGSHVVFGTIVIRTSDKLTATQQNDLTEQIKSKLIELK